MRSHAHQMGLVLQDLCDRFLISQRYACLLFQMELHTTFRKRLNRYRIERACALLEKGDLPMYHIAEACGFRNQRRFAEVFRREKKTSPTHYRITWRHKSYE
ncbi:MAG: helix-turn-helix transcriptional regulator [Candidatus Latescibacterota bacterium]